MADRFEQHRTFVRCSIRCLPHGAALTWLALWDFADAEGWTFVGQDKLAEILGVNPRTVRRNIARLVRLGYLVIEVAGGRGRGNNDYRIVPYSSEGEWERLDRLFGGGVEQADEASADGF
jgi:hypothetical protein